MIDGDLLIEELVRDEGLRLKPYRCTAGKLTIGCGRNLDDRGITRAEALYLAHNDVSSVMDELDAQLPWWTQLDPVRQRVIVNMGFNLGIDGLLPGGAKPGFPRTLELIRTGRYPAAADAMLLSLWAREVGPRAQRLAAMMRDGVTARVVA